MRNLMKTKLKLYAFLVLSGLMGSQAALAKTEPNLETPHDFAFGANLSVEDDSPFYRINLPETLYSNTVWPDLRDVRVFNREGLVQPFAFMHYNNVHDETTVFPVTVFSMNSQGVEKSDNNNRQARLKAADGLTITIPLYGNDPIDKSYLLKMADTSDSSGIPNRLILNWPKSEKNWQTTVSVYYSDTTKNWSQLISDAPLMDLTSGNERLLVNSIDLGNSSRLYGAHYYLLVFKGSQENLVPVIDKAEAVYLSRRAEDKTIEIPFQGKELEKGVAEYILPTPKTLKSLRILPAQDNVVLPLEVEYRSSETAKWLPLPKQVVYQLSNRNNGKSQSAALEINDRQVQGIRIKAINTSWGNALPKVIGERKQVALVFNAQGNGPYILAWGSQGAKSYALSLETLVPEAMRSAEELNAMSWVHVGSSIELGGIERLTQESNSAESNGEWKKFLLWGILIVGVIGLSLFAFKIWQEVTLKTKQ